MENDMQVGFEHWAAAARTEPLCMGRTLHQLSQRTAQTHDLLNKLCSIAHFTSESLALGCPRSHLIHCSNCLAMSQFLETSKKVKKIM